jgi:nitronate monooxygenase
VRRFWDGPIVLAGAISDGRAVRAAEVLGADLAYVGTRFIAAQESMASADYHRLLVEAGAEDVMITDRVSGVPANFLIASMERVGFDPDAVARHDKIDFSDDPHDDAKAWKDIWAAGQGVGAVDAIEPLADIAARLKDEYATAVAEGRGPNQWLDSKASAAAE